MRNVTAADKNASKNERKAKRTLLPKAIKLTVEPMTTIQSKVSLQPPGPKSPSSASIRGKESICVGISYTVLYSITVTGFTGAGNRFFS